MKKPQLVILALIALQAATGCLFGTDLAGPPGALGADAGAADAAGAVDSGATGPGGDAGAEGDQDAGEDGGEGSGDTGVDAGKPFVVAPLTPTAITCPSGTVPRPIALLRPEKFDLVADAFNYAPEHPVALNFAAAPIARELPVGQEAMTIAWAQAGGGDLRVTTATALLQGEEVKLFAIGQARASNALPAGVEIFGLQVHGDPLPQNAQDAYIHLYDADVHTSHGTYTCSYSAPGNDPQAVTGECTPSVPYADALAASQLHDLRRFDALFSMRTLAEGPNAGWLESPFVNPSIVMAAVGATDASGPPPVSMAVLRMKNWQLEELLVDGVVTSGAGFFAPHLVLGVSPESNGNPTLLALGRGDDGGDAAARVLRPNGSLTGYTLVESWPLAASLDPRPGRFAFIDAVAAAVGSAYNGYFRLDPDTSSTAYGYIGIDSQGRLVLSRPGGFPNADFYGVGGGGQPFSELLGMRNIQLGAGEAGALFATVRGAQREILSLASWNMELGLKRFDFATDSGLTNIRALVYPGNLYRPGAMAFKADAAGTAVLGLVSIGDASDLRGSLCR